MTLLSGDLLDDDRAADFPDGPSYVENCYHIVTCNGVDATAVLDGFYIEGGHAHGSYPHDRGGGIYATNGDPKISNCTVFGNSASLYGGGMYNNAGAPMLEKCAFEGNLSNSSGGAVFNEGGDPKIVDCKLAANRALGLHGGAVYNWSGSSPKVLSSRFTGNTAGTDGGGMANASGSPVIANCIFSENAAADGGAMYNADGSSSETSDPVITNCIMWGNTAISEPQIFNESSSSPVITYNCIQHGWSGTGNIGELPEHNPLYIDADGLDNIPGTEDDNLHLQAGSPCLDTGSNATSELPETDFDGHRRVLCDIVDMGAYEFGIGDHQCNEDVDLSDFAAWEACMTGPDADQYPPRCEAFDFEFDRDVDLQDFGKFQAIFEGQ